MIHFFLASLLSFSNLRLPHQTSHLPKIAISSDKIHLTYLSPKDLSSLSDQMAFYLNKDVQGEFKPLLDETVLIKGDIVAFGTNAKNIDLIGTLQDERQFLYIVTKNRSAQLAVDHISDPKWKQQFAYQGYYRQNTSSLSTSTHSSTPMFWNGLLTSHFVNKGKLPFVLTPKNPTTFTLPQLVHWNASRQWQMQSVLNEHGAILLRNCCVRTPKDFAILFASILGQTTVNGWNKCTNVQMPLHHKLSYTYSPPAYISFFCDTPPLPEAGQMLLGRTEDITKAIHKHPKVWNFFKNKNIKYVSRYPKEENVFTKANKAHLTWPEAFATTDKSDVEKICLEKGLDYEWQGDWLVTSTIAPAIRGPDKYYPFEYWYNQIHLYHANSRSRGGFFNHFLTNLLYLDPSTRQYDVTLEDGTSIADDIVYAIYDAFEACTIKFDWQKGDVLVIDNRKILNGQSEGTEKSKIFTLIMN